MPEFAEGTQRRRPGLRLTGAAAGVVVAALTVGGVGAVGLITGPVGQPGLFNPGRPLHCSGLRAMQPPAAARYLTERGYSVIWQIENVDNRSSTMSAQPPASGNVVDGVVHGNEMLLVVEVGAGVLPAPTQDDTVDC